MSNFVDKPSSDSSTSSLGQWLHQTLAPSDWSIKFQLRGNNLHILCEGDSCPSQRVLFQTLVPALQKTDVNILTPSGSPPIYQIQLYSSKSSHDQPLWMATIYLNQLDHHLEQLQQTHESSQQLSAGQQPGVATVRVIDRPSTAVSEQFALALSNRSLARQGHETAIASYLSEALSHLGVALRVNVKSIPFAVNSSVYSTDTAMAAVTTKRLWIACEAPYSPEPSLVGEAITQQLRDLEIVGYRDAVIRFQVTGETEPDWLLRIDLTPAEEMLREWARWGDIEALQRILNQAVVHLGVRFTTASLKEVTLHLGCERIAGSSTDSQPLDAAIIKAEILPLLDVLGPQGIHAIALYGQTTSEQPEWVEWLELPAAVHPALSASAMRLAQQQDWAAVAFLLHRLLNSDLDKYLATGGIRLQLLPKHDLLHIMSEAVLCPNQRQVGYTIAHFLESLKLPDITGVRVYGRRSGQKHPLWSYGIDFVQRDRIVPDATPEFAATDTCIDELVTHSVQEPIFRPDLTPTDLQTVWTNLQHRLLVGSQRLLVRSQLFISASSTEASALALPQQMSYHGAKVVLVWGAVGVLLTMQTNWFLERLLTQSLAALEPAPPILTPPANTSTSVVSSTTPIEPEPVSDLGSSDLNRSPQGDDHLPSDDTFDLEGFTAPLDDAEASSPEGNSAPLQTVLPYTRQDAAVNQALATSLASDTTLPDFNSQQLNDKLKLYYRQVEEFGAPDVLIIGSSRALRGVDPTALSSALAEMGYPDVDIFNFGINGATAQVADLVLRQILKPGQLPRLIIWADGARAFNSHADDVTYNGITAAPAYQDLLRGQLDLPDAGIPTTAGATEPPLVADEKGLNVSLTESYQAIDRWLSEQIATISGTYEERDQLKHLLQRGFTAAFPEVEATASAPLASASNLPADYEFVDVHGFLSLGVQFNPATYYQKYAKVSGDYDRDYLDFQIRGTQEDALMTLLQYTQAQQVPIVFVNLPMTDQYLDAARLEHEQEFRDFMVRTSLQQSGFVFRDLGEQWQTQYDYFSDPSHLNRYGAYAVAQHLAQDPKIPWVVVTQKSESALEE